MNCPICHKPSVKEFDPFCSSYCKNVDLLKWLNEGYRIPDIPSDEEEQVEVPVHVPSDEDNS